MPHVSLHALMEYVHRILHSKPQHSKHNFMFLTMGIILQLGNISWSTEVNFALKIPSQERVLEGLIW